MNTSFSLLSLPYQQSALAQSSGEASVSIGNASNPESNNNDLSQYAYEHAKLLHEYQVGTSKTLLEQYEHCVWAINRLNELAANANADPLPHPLTYYCKPPEPPGPPPQPPDAISGLNETTATTDAINATETIPIPGPSDEFNIRDYELRLKYYEDCVWVYNRYNEMGAQLGPLAQFCGEPPQPSAAISRLNKSSTTTTTDATNATQIITTPALSDENATDNQTGLTAPNLRIVFSTFIEPGSFIDGKYQPRQSNVFAQDEIIEFYVEYVGTTTMQVPDPGDRTVFYSTDVSATYTITDEDGNVEISYNSPRPPLGSISETEDDRFGQVFTYKPGFPPELEIGNYTMGVTLTDNLSGEKANADREFIIEGEETETEDGVKTEEVAPSTPTPTPPNIEEQPTVTNITNIRIVNNTFTIIPGSANGTNGVYPPNVTNITNLRIVNDTFIEPGSANGTRGVYRLHESKIFRANETIELYTELAGMIEKRIVNNTNNNIQYLTNISGTLNITDREGNMKASSTYSKGFGPFSIKFTDIPVSNNNSYVFGFNPASPPLETGEYNMNFTITDNLSGENVSVAKDVVLEGEKEDFRIVFDTFIVPGSANGTHGVYEERKSNVFKPDENIEFYMELDGLTQKPIVSESTADILHYITNTTGNFTIADKQGNVINITDSNFSPFDSETLYGRVDNYSYTFYYYPGSLPLEPGNYTMTFTITDNLSGEKVEVTKDIVIKEDEEIDEEIIDVENDTLINDPQ